MDEVTYLMENVTCLPGTHITKYFRKNTEQ